MPSPRWLAIVLLVVPATSVADPATVRIAVRDGQRWGFVDGTGTLVIPFKYTTPGEFHDGVACVDHTYLDLAGKPLRPAVLECAPFHEGRSRVRTKAGLGFVDTKGAIWLARGPNKEPVTELGDFHDGLARARVGGKWGWITKTGSWGIPPTYGVEIDPDIQKVADECAAKNERDGELPTSECLSAFAATGSGEFADDFSEGLAAVKVGDRWGFVAPNGKLAIAPTWTTKPGPFSSGLAEVPLSSGSEAYIDKTGTVLIAGPFRSAGTFHEGVAVVVDKTQHFIDVTGKARLTPPANATSLGEFSGGLAAIAGPDRKYGFIDKAGKWVVRPVFANATPFIDGFAQVSFVSDKPYLAIIDPTGKPIWVEHAMTSAFERSSAAT
ncbi:MAG: WG repeat-containing protein [Proteobacteria bacterium]|nr:WG repeat-containing protein [Pseudomonadota bacterium]